MLQLAKEGGAPKRIVSRIEVGALGKWGGGVNCAWHGMVDVCMYVRIDRSIDRSIRMERPHTHKPNTHKPFHNPYTL